MSESSEVSETFFFSLLSFVQFLSENRVFSITIASILSSRFDNLITSLINDIIFPIINQDYDNNGEDELTQLEKHKLSIGGITLGTGKVVASLIRFIIVTCVIYVLAKLIWNIEHKKK